MKLFTYLKKLYPLLLENSSEELTDHEITLITDNSSEVIDGAVFVAIKGIENDGHDYISEAIQKGAKTILYENSISKKCDNINYLQVESSKKEYEQFLINECHKIIDKVKIIGITGTNGKTTVATLTYELFEFCNKNVMFIGTNGMYIHYNGENQFIDTPNTTPKLSIILRELLNYPRLDYLIMEVSSEALANKRVEGIKFDIVLMNNIGHDHLNTHLSQEDYVNSKLKLFEKLKSDNGVAIVNQDDAESIKFKNVAKSKNANIFTFGINLGSFKGELLKLTENYMMCKIIDDSHELTFGTNLLGKFNLLNILASLSIVKSQNFELIHLLDYFGKTIQIPGRYQKLNVNNKRIFIDYAHNPEAIKEVLQMLSSIKGKHKLITVIGAGGKKDVSKRPKMGYYANYYSDLVIFTEDTSRGENPKDIIEDLKKGLINDKCCVVVDRLLAIKKALKIAESRDIVAILGMGNDAYGTNIKYTDYLAVMQTE